MALGCFDSYNFVYSEELHQDFGQRNNERCALVVARRHRAGEVKCHVPPDLIKPNPTAFSAGRKLGNAHDRKVCKASRLALLTDTSRHNFGPDGVLARDKKISSVEAIFSSTWERSS